MNIFHINYDIINFDLSKFISYKYYIILHISCKKLYNNKLSEDNLKQIYYTPKDEYELTFAVNEWCYNINIAKEKYGDINRWNTKNIINMSHLFYCKVYFNDNIEDWIVYNVKDMSYMFYCACHYNKPLNSWNVKNVENMKCLFNSAGNFNQPLNKWNISKLHNADYLLANTFKFNQDLSKWKIRRKYTEVKGMFYNTPSLLKEYLPKYNG